MQTLLIQNAHAIGGGIHCQALTANGFGGLLLAELRHADAQGVAHKRKTQKTEADESPSRSQLDRQKKNDQREKGKHAVRKDDFRQGLCAHAPARVVRLDWLPGGGPKRAEEEGECPGEIVPTACWGLVDDLESGRSVRPDGADQSIKR